MSNRAARRRNEREAGKTARAKGLPAIPLLNVFLRDRNFVCQVGFGDAYRAEFVLDQDGAQNFVKECQEVLTQMETGIQVARSSNLIIP